MSLCDEFVSVSFALDRRLGRGFDMIDVDTFRDFPHLQLLQNNIVFVSN